MGQARFKAIGIADSSGNVTLAFNLVNVNATITARVSVPLSELAVTWQVMINDLTVATRQGPSEEGSLQLTSSDLLTVSSTNATPGVQYTAVLIGSLDYAGAAPIAPTPTAATVTELTVNPAVPGILLGPETPLGGGPFAVIVPDYIRTLIIEIGVSASATVSNVLVQGSDTNFIYYNDAPYLQGEVVLTRSGYFIVIPLLGALDGIVAITITSSNLLDCLLTVYGDTEQYQESLFYTLGGATPASFNVSGAGSGTLCTGPLRILTASASCGTASGSAVLKWNGSPWLVAPMGATAGGVVDSLSPAWPLILPSGISITYTITAGGQVNVLATYP